MSLSNDPTNSDEPINDEIVINEHYIPIEPKSFDVTSNGITKYTLQSMFSKLRVPKVYHSLSDKTWLDDYVIDAFAELLTEKFAEDPNNALSFHVFTCHLIPTYFYRSTYNFENVSTWTQHVHGTIFEKNLLFFPLNLNNNHWLLAVVHVKSQLIFLFDSLSPNSHHRTHTDRFITVIEHYLNDEYKRVYRKKKSFYSCNAPFQLKYGGAYLRLLYDPVCPPIHTEIMNSRIPNQTNGYDCGIYVLLSIFLIATRHFDLSILNDLAPIGRIFILSALLTKKLDRDSVAPVITKALNTRLRRERLVSVQSIHLHA